ncbi:MAG: hypothetical protein U1E60_32295 [Reyranellaceae bacterium]
MVDLDRKLNFIGKKAFVDNFELFRCFAEGKCAKEAAISELVNQGVSKPGEPPHS